MTRYQRGQIQWGMEKEDIVGRADSSTPERAATRIWPTSAAPKGPCMCGKIQLPHPILFPRAGVIEIYPITNSDLGSAESAGLSMIPHSFIINSAGELTWPASTTPSTSSRCESTPDRDRQRPPDGQRLRQRSSASTRQATTAAVQTGFSELYTLVNYTDQLLQYEIAQNNTMICYLDKIAQQTCALLNEAALQTAAQQAMRDGPPRSQAALRAGQPGRRGRATPPRGSKGTDREVLPTAGAGAAVQVRAVQAASATAPERRRDE